MGNVLDLLHVSYMHNTKNIYFHPFLTKSLSNAPLTQIPPLSTYVDLFSRAIISMIWACKTDFFAWIDYKKDKSCVFTIFFPDKCHFHLQLFRGKSGNSVVSAHFHFPTYFFFRNSIHYLVFAFFIRQIIKLSNDNEL